MRSVFASCLLFAAFAIASIAWDAAVAHADEIFELENGVVLRGYVMRESEEEVTIRLTGFARTNTVTVGKDRIKKRYATSAPTSSTDPIAPKPFTPSTPSDVTISTSYRPPDLHEDDTSKLPEDEPEIEDESFMERFLRLARVAIPESLHAQVTVGLLLAIVLLVLISGGARLADVDDTPFFGTAILAVLLGGFLVVDLLQYDQLLRADRALWVLPGQTLAWIGAARILYGGSIGRCVLVFAFTIVSLMTVVFATGAVFVAV